HAPLNTYKHKNQRKIRNYTTTNHTPTPPKRCSSDPPKQEGHPMCGLMLATTIHKSNTTPHHQDGATTKPPTPRRGQRKTGLLPQDPTVCLAVPQTPTPER